MPSGDQHAELTWPPSTFHLSLVHNLFVYQTLNTVEVVAENISSRLGDHNTYRDRKQHIIFKAGIRYGGQIFFYCKAEIQPRPP